MTWLWINADRIFKFKKGSSHNNLDQDQLARLSVMFHVEFQSLSCSSHRESDLEFSGFMSRLFIDSFQSSDEWRVLKTLKLVSASADGTIITLSSLLGLFSPPCRTTARILQCHNLKCAVCPVCSRGLSIRNKTMSSVGSWELLYEHTATLNRTTNFVVNAWQTWHITSLSTK